MAKATRLDEKMREFRAARAPRATPNTIIWRPYGMIPFAISAIALLLPVTPPGEACSRRQDKLGPAEQSPEVPIATKATRTKISVEKPITRKWARGMFFSGFLASSPVCAMIS